MGSTTSPVTRAFAHCLGSLVVAGMQAQRHALEACEDLVLDLVVGSTRNHDVGSAAPTHAPATFEVAEPLVAKKPESRGGNVGHFEQHMKDKVRFYFRKQPTGDTQDVVRRDLEAITGVINVEWTSGEVTVLQVHYDPRFDAEALHALFEGIVVPATGVEIISNDTPFKPKAKKPKDQPKQ